MTKREIPSANIRFAEILRLLKEKDQKNTQVHIMEKLNLDFINDESYFSDLKSGKRKKLPDQLIDRLHECFNVNPDYLRLKSNLPFDNAVDHKLESFLNFVDDWNVAISKDDKNDKYLHLTLDRNFYDFLIELNRAYEITDEGFSSLEQEKDTLKKLYSSSPSPEEFVLIPRNIFWEIVQVQENKHKYLSEVLDLTKCSSYIDTTEEIKLSPMSKKERLNSLQRTAQNEKDDQSTY